MPDTTVEDEFARFAEAYTGSFRPVPVEAMRRWRGARRRAAAWLAGLGAALVAAVAANALQPAAPAGPGGNVVERPVHLAGARGDMDVQFVDARHGWVAFNDCRADGTCDTTLGRSADGGRSWTRVAVPAQLPGSHTMLAAEGPDAALIGTGSPAAWWRTTDGGRTFAPAGADSSQVAVDARLRLLGVGPQDPPGAGDPVPSAPGSPAALAHAPDGRLWAVTHDGLSSHAAFSPDGGRTWRVLRPDLPGNAALRVSPDGRDAWAVTDLPTRVYRLGTDGAATVLPDFPTSVVAQGVRAVDGGGLLGILPGAGAGIWRAGRFAALPAPMARATAVTLLPDGSIIAYLGPDGVAVGREGGQWVWHRPPA